MLDEILNNSDINHLGVQAKQGICLQIEQFINP